MSISGSRSREFWQLVDEYVAAGADRPANPVSGHPVNTQRYTNSWRALAAWLEKFEKTCRQAGAAGERKRARTAAKGGGT